MDLEAEEIKGDQRARRRPRVGLETPGEVGHQPAEDPDDRADDPDLGAGGVELGGGRPLEDAAHARAAPRDRQRLPPPALGAGDHRWDLARETGVIDHELQDRIVRALEDHRRRRRLVEEAGERGLVDVDRAGVDLEVAGPPPERPRGRLGLAAADVADVEEDLALEVRDLDDVAIDDGDPTGAGGDEPEERGAAEAARPEDQEVALPWIASARRHRLAQLSGARPRR
ncbi:MAG: hypothetical protein R3B09_28365 [Nannocystaceae bacterium]